jgi:single-stranded-DNA-specific exonuclease
VTSAALLYRFFESVGVRTDVFVPDRFRDGYGLNADRIRELVEAGSQVLITVDCGTSNRDEVAIAQNKGCDVVVVDHHKVPPKPAEPFALLNPMRPDCSFEHKKIAAVAVAFFLCVALRRELRSRSFFTEGQPQPDLRGLLELVALGTVADVMPLVDLNRMLVTQGLSTANRNPSVGIRALAAGSGIEDRPITSTDFGFKLGPRINAAGRMTNARGGLDLLTTKDPELARDLSHRLNTENQARRDVERSVLDEAMEDAAMHMERGVKTLVLYRPHWHLGVVGIVAARIKEAFHRPTFILGQHPDDGAVKGSGRSISGFDLVDALHHCSSGLVQFGGHAYAAGVTLNEAQLETFRANLEGVGQEQLSDNDLIPEIRIDAALDPDLIDLSLYDSMEALAPFGAGNPRPVFALKGIQVASFRIVGKDKTHLSLNIRTAQGRVRGIGFGMAEQSDLLDQEVDLAVRLKDNHWQGRRSAEFQLVALRPSER